MVKQADKGSRYWVEHNITSYGRVRSLCGQVTNLYDLNEKDTVDLSVDLEPEKYLLVCFQYIGYN